MAKKLTAEEEAKRLDGMYRIEREKRLEGHNIICGTDEAGRGPLAGPVSVSYTHLDVYKRQDYAYEVIYGRDYSSEDADMFFGYVKQYIVPVYVVLAGIAVSYTHLKGGAWEKLYGA